MNRYLILLFWDIILNTALSWKYHIIMIAIKLSKVIGILHKLKYIFPKDILLTIYKSLIFTTFELWHSVMGSTPARHFYAPEKAIRVVTNNTYKSQTQPIFKEYGLLNVNDNYVSLEQTEIFTQITSQQFTCIL